MPVGEFPKQGADDVAAQCAGMFDDPFLLEDIDRSHRGRACQGMPGVGQPSRVGPFIEGGSDLLRDDDTPERNVAGVDALGEGDQVGCHVPAVAGEPFTAAAEPGHHLIGHEHDAEFVADRPDPGQVVFRRNQNTVGTHDGFEDDRRHGVRPLDSERVPKVGQCPLALLRLVLRVEGGMVGVGPPVVDDAGHGRLGGPPPRVTGQGDRARRGSVVAAAGCQNLGSSGVQPGHPHGILIGFGPAVGKEDLVQVARCQLGNQPRRFGPGVIGEGGSDCCQFP